MFFDLDSTLLSTYQQILFEVENIWPKIIGAIMIILIWIILARWFFIFAMFIFKKIKLNEIIDKLNLDISEESKKENKKNNKKDLENNDENQNNDKKITITSKIKVDDLVSKAISYYIIIVFFRISISYIWIHEIEDFLRDLTDYLPNLFIWVLIGFFGIRFANFIYDVVYHTLSLTKDKTSKIVATWAKIIILFFTLMLFLDYTKVVSSFIINTIIIWFISMISLWAWLAFWLWGKEIAREILESFRK